MFFFVVSIVFEKYTCVSIGALSLIISGNVSVTEKEMDNSVLVKLTGPLVKKNFLD